MSLMEETESLLRNHQSGRGIPSEVSESAWTLLPSPQGGRGVFATKDLPAGALVFVDAPLVLGPRAGARSVPLCVGCHYSGGVLVPCSKGCGLPVCSRDCEIRCSHAVECDYLVRWRGKKIVGDKWCPLLLRAVAPIRCLGLNDAQRRLVRCLQMHSGPQHEGEMELIRQSLNNGPSGEDEEFMRVCCCAMDANAFEVEVNPTRDSLAARPRVDSLGVMTSHEGVAAKSSVRGLYPLAAMMNHACTPNTRHGYDLEHRMVVRATTDITRGTEVTTSYTALLWGSPVRRHHLAMTKHFHCECARCRDPQEGGSRLCALKCALEDCPGSMFPLDPIKSGAKWVCDHCGLRMPDKQARMIQASLGQMLSTISAGGPTQIASFLRGHQALLPSSNQLVVEMKTSLIWALGHRQGYHYNNLTQDDLAVKMELCRELLSLLKVLQAGQCRMRGLLLYELYESLMEKQRRSNEESKVDEQEALEVLDEVREMFVDDVTSPTGTTH